MQQALLSKPVLRINMDETSLCVHQSRGKGILCVDKPSARALKRNVPRRLKRLCMTYAASICDNSDAQKHLPQYLIANEATLKVKRFAALERELHPHVKLLRRKSAWCNQEIIIEILRDMATFARARGYLPLLLWDAARPHVTPRVFAAARRMGVWVCVIPAGSTHLLQPLDTHCFARFKHSLVENVNRSVIGGAGPCPVEAFLRCARQSVCDEVLNRSWAHAFAANGYGHHGRQMEEVSERVSKELGLARNFDISNDRPRFEDVTVCFPKRVKLSERSVFAPFVEVAPLPARKKTIQPSREVIGRTRSQTAALRSKGMLLTGGTK